MIAHTEAQEGRPLRTTEEIAASYDEQAEESFRKKLENPFFERYGRAVGRYLAQFKPESVLDAGCGDGVTMACVIEESGCAIEGFDVSKKRLYLAAKHLGRRAFQLRYGELSALPISHDYADLVYTSHAIEPNGGREPQILKELHRVARRYLVLFEPDYDAAPPEGKARMERLGYCTHLHETIQHLGLPLVKHGPFSEIGNQLNPTSVWVIKKAGHA